MGIRRGVLIGCVMGTILTLSGCDRLKPGRRAPELSVVDLGGRTLTLSSLRGRVVLVGFFATWAPPCRLAMLTWARHQRTYARRGLSVLGVAVHEDRAVLERTLKASPPGFAVGIGADEQVKRWLGGEDVVLPTAYLIDGHGRIHARFLGVHPGDAMTADIERAITALPALTPTEDP